jgi:hypothetical protein
MRYLRTVSTRRLLATLAGLVIAIGGGTAIAVAATSGGPVPAPQRLASALRQALTAKAPAGITAGIQFTNNLISSTAISGATDPLLTGATGRLWLTKDRLRLELQSNNGDAQIVADKTGFWVYDPASNTVYKGSWASLGVAPGAAAKGAAAKGAAKAGGHAADHGVPTIADIQTELTKLAAHLNISGAAPTDVAGQAAYRVTVAPKHDGGLLGDVGLAWDAIRGIPLDFAVYASGDSTPVLELQATDITYGPVALSDLQIAPPRSAKVVQVATAHAASAPRTTQLQRLRGKLAKAKSAGHVEGVSAVAGKLSFPLSAKPTLGGLTRQSVKLLDWSGSPAALVLYGKGLGGIAVIERAAKAGHAGLLGAGSSPTKGSSGSGAAGGSPLNLPTVSIGGATGQELDTSLGSLLSFTRSGVSYTLVGSVPAAAIEVAARDL